MTYRGLEFLFLLLFAVSAAAHFHSRRLDLKSEIKRTRRAMLFTGTGALVLAYPLGWWHLQDVLLIAGLVLFAIAAAVRQDAGLSRMFIGLGGLGLVLWVWIHQMTTNQTLVGFGLAAACAGAMEFFLLAWQKQPPNDDGHHRFRAVTYLI